MNNKIIYFFLVALLISPPIFSQDYCWHKGEKVRLVKHQDRNFYLFSDSSVEYPTLKIVTQKVYEKHFHHAIGNIEITDNIEYISPAVITPDGDTFNFSHLFYVKLKNEKDYELLKQKSDKNKIEILGQNQFMSLWYTLACSKYSTGNALEMTNLFHESELFSVVEADILGAIIPHCATDPQFSNQWGLKNTGQYGGTPGIDINLCNVWSDFTKGNPSVIVAVVDNGIQKNHPDLISSIHPLSYDAFTNSSPSTVHIQHSQDSSHGTQVAGVIAAKNDNGIGVAGIASNCKIMDISIRWLDWIKEIYYVDQQNILTNGISWAWKNGASVINCSWGIFSHSGYYGTFIEDAIDSATILGRNGKGCIVVVSTGNDDNSSTNIWTPVSHPNVIAVGAISQCGERKSRQQSCDNNLNWGFNWGSNYGTRLDIMAPGVLVPSTIIHSGYNPYFGGTSAAAPHIAGVAALMLSVNPDLTRQQVKNILEQTARKVGPYKYETTPGRPNGLWHREMGYGLVNAYEAVKQAINLCSTTNLNGTQTTRKVYCRNITIQNATIPNGVTLELIATGKITIGQNVVINSGGRLEIKAFGSSTIDSGFKVMESGKFIVN